MTNAPPPPAPPNPPVSSETEQSQGNESNRLATAGVLTALLALVLSIIVIGGLLAVVSLVLSGLGLRKARELQNGRGIAITGIVLSLTAMIASIGAVVFFTIAVNTEETVRDGIATTSSNTRFPPQDDLDGVECTESEGGGSALAIATLTNRSGGPSVYTVTFTWQRSNGESSAMVRSDSIPADATEELRLFAPSNDVIASECRVTRIERTGLSLFGG